MHPGPLVVAGSGYREYREYTLRALAGRYPVWLVDPDPPTWQQPYLTGSSTVDVAAADGVERAARALRDAGVRPAGILCYDETRVHAAARLAGHLGLPTSPPDAVAACRDKATTRARLTGTGVHQPRSVPVATLAQARHAADGIGYPLVLKARALAGSSGVLRVDHPDGLPAAFAAADGAQYPGCARFADNVLVEEYVDGPEISVDSIVVNGVVTPVAVARKQLGYAPFFEETGHLVDARDPLLADSDLRVQLELIHRGLGYDTGVTHCEFRLHRGRPYLIEVNARLGGDLIPYIAGLATGVDLPLLAAAVSTGAHPAVRPTAHRVAAVAFLYPPRDCTVAGIDIDRSRLPGAVRTVAPLAAPGERLALPPRGYANRFAAVTAVADTADEVRAALDIAREAVTLRESTPAVVTTPA